MIGHLLGLDNASGPWYLFWSGFGSDLSEVAGLGLVVYMFWRKHNCHEPGCWRIGAHSYRDPEGHEHVHCRRHHQA